MAKKSNASMFFPGLPLSVAVAGVALSLMACSDSGGADDTTGGVGGATSDGVGPTTTGQMAATQGGPTMGSTAVGSTVTSGTTLGSTTTSATGAGGSSTSGVGGASSSTSGGGLATSMGGSGTSAGGMGMGAGGSTTGVGGASSTGTGGSGGTSTDEDLDMTAADFSCIGDWDRVSGFRITNLLGHLQEALDVANSPDGGVYPVGTVIQHLPTEAMVKRRAGFSPETKDWEFFQLELSSDGMTTITNRGTDNVMTMGNSCPSCHSMVPDQWDFICNTWGDHGGDCGFDFDDSFLATQLGMDTRCQ